MRSHNLAMLLHLAWMRGEVSRIELVRETGLAPSTVSKLVGELIDAGLVYESHPAPAGGGRPPIVLRFVDDRNHLVGVDLGATHVSVAVTNLRARILAWRTRPHPVQTDPRGTLDLAESLVRDAVAEIGTSMETVIGLGLAVPSPVDPDRPDAMSPSILPAWADVGPASTLGTRLGVPVWMDNDANLCALAETWHGAGRGTDSLAFLKLGTGIGAGIVVDGALLHGGSGFAGEIGHTSLDLHGPPCVCGLRGCLQTMAGSAATLARVTSLLDAGRASTLRDTAPLTLAGVARAARHGDPVAMEAVGETARHLGVAVANLFNLVNPSVLVLGGALTEAGPVLTEPIEAAIAERALWAAIARAEVRVTRFGDRVAAVGAATRVLQEALADPTLLTRRAATPADFRPLRGQPEPASAP